MISQKDREKIMAPQLRSRGVVLVSGRSRCPTFREAAILFDNYQWSIAKTYFFAETQYKFLLERMNISPLLIAGVALNSSDSEVRRFTAS